MTMTTTKPDTSKTTPSTKKLDSTEQKGNLLIHEFWKNGTYSAHAMHVLNTDANPHSAKKPEKCLHEAERAKKNVPGGMTPVTSTFFAVRHLCSWATGYGGGGLPKKDTQPPHKKVATILI